MVNKAGNIVEQKEQKLEDIDFAKLKKVVLASISKEKIEKEILRLEKFAVRKLSHEDVVNYLGDVLNNPSSKFDEEIIQPKKEELHNNCVDATVRSDYIRDKNQAVSNVGYTGQELAHDITEGMKKLQGLAKVSDDNKKSESLIKAYGAVARERMKALLSKNAASDSENARVSKIAEDVAISKFTKIKDIFAKNPKLKSRYVNMPDISELGNITPDDVCKVVTGLPIGAREI